MIRCMDEEMRNHNMNFDPILKRRADKFMYDVSLYDDHFVPASRIRVMLSLLIQFSV